MGMAPVLTDCPGGREFWVPCSGALLVTLGRWDAFVPVRVFGCSRGLGAFGVSGVAVVFVQSGTAGTIMVPVYSLALML